MRTTSKLALIGISIGLIGLTSMFVPRSYYAFHVNQDRLQRFYFKSAQPRLLPECTVTLQEIDRAVKFDRSFNMIVDVSLDPPAVGCKTWLRLSAAAFDVKPESVECNLSKNSAQQT